MEKNLKIYGQNDLSWTVSIWWSKNAVLPLLAWAILIKDKVILNNVPRIWDVFTFLEILEDFWVLVNFEWNTLEIDSSNMQNTKADSKKFNQIRASILLIWPLLHHFWKANLFMPGGCNLGKRPIDSHTKWFENMWYNLEYFDDNIEISWNAVTSDIVLDAGFSVTWSENLITANVLRKWKTTIKSLAIEPHVIDLIDFFKKAWADLELSFDNTLVINWVESLKSIEHNVVSDYLQSWTFMIIGALSAWEYIDIENARIDDLYVFISKLREAWVKIEELWDDKVRVYRAKKLSPVSIQTNLHPWFPTDIQSPFWVLMTQCEWTSKIDEILFENRLTYLNELEKMWAKVSVLNRHKAEIKWKKQLVWEIVTSWDLRAWAAMVIAWLIASGETTITNVKYIERGYEDIFSKLKSLWAKIDY